jgi:hypothetical protein
MSDDRRFRILGRFNRLSVKFVRLQIADGGESEALRLSILNLGADTSTATGKLIFTIIGAVGLRLARLAFWDLRSRRRRSNPAAKSQKLGIGAGDSLSFAKLCRLSSSRKPPVAAPACRNERR